MGNSKSRYSDSRRKTHQAFSIVIVVGEIVVSRMQIHRKVLLAIIIADCVLDAIGEII